MIYYHVLCFIPVKQNLFNICKNPTLSNLIKYCALAVVFSLSKHFVFYWIFSRTYKDISLSIILKILPGFHILLWLKPLKLSHFLKNNFFLEKIQSQFLFFFFLFFFTFFPCPYLTVIHFSTFETHHSFKMLLFQLAITSVLTDSWMLLCLHAEPLPGIIIAINIPFSLKQRTHKVGHSCWGRDSTIICTKVLAF